MKAPSTTASDFDSSRGRSAFARTPALLLFVGLVLALAVVPKASADTTHPFLHYITLPPGATDPQPASVDSEGNLLVWLNGQHELAKFDPDGNPVDFSALGTNILDGAGNFDCSNTPSDCDRVPSTNGFEGNATYQQFNTSTTEHQIVAVDHSGGPADGYIYIENVYDESRAKTEHHMSGSEVDVFSPGGKYLGYVDMSEVGPVTLNVSPGPGNFGPTDIGGLSMSPNGILYMLHPGITGANAHVDGFAAVDGNPAHDQFIGQIHAGPNPFNETGAAASYSQIAVGNKYTYADGNEINLSAHWQKYLTSEFARRGPMKLVYATPLNLSNGTAPTWSLAASPFGNGGLITCCGQYSGTYSRGRYGVVIDPTTEDIYLGWGNGDPLAGIQQWDPDNNQIGPEFGLGHLGSAEMLTIDRSGGQNDGDIYVQGLTGRIAVFGNPVTVPDISVHLPDAEHENAQLSATIGRAGGPQVDECHIEYGETASYGTIVPCDAPTPYLADTNVSLNVPNLAPENDYHYRVTASNSNGVNDSGDNSFHTHAVLGVVTDPASSLDRTTADLNGSLNPDGMSTEYSFEWGASTAYGEQTPWLTAPAGAVPATMPPVGIGNLQAARTYHFRLVATNSLGITYGQDRTFTVPASPRILSVTPKNVTSTSADLTARINPGGFDSAYYFEYGLTSSYEHSTPETDIGNSSSPLQVSAPLTDLEPGATYHFRVVATNDWGTSISSDSTVDFFPPSCPNSHIRQQVGANYLPDCRAYELVSPEDAGGVALFPGTVVNGTGNFEKLATMSPQNSRGLASAPSRFGFFGGFGAINGLNVPNSLIDRYVATRTNLGWVTSNPGRSGDEALTLKAARCNGALSKCVDEEAPDLFVGVPRPNAAYMWSVDGEHLGRLPTNVEEVPGGDFFIGAETLSLEFDHFVFSSRTIAFAPGGLETRPGSAYDNDTDKKSIVIVSKLANGQDIPRDSGNNSEFIKFPAVSDSGSHILMSTVAPGGTTHLYMRVDDAVSYDVSHGIGVKFVGMTGDGSQVFFTSTAHLLPTDTDTSADLYRWSEAGDTLSLLSQGNGNGDTDSCNASWTSGCGVAPLTTNQPALDNILSADTGDVYFYSPEQLDGANPGVRNERNLYVFRGGRPQYVTTLDSGTQIDRMQVSPDDLHAAFLTRAKVTGYDNAGWEEMYTYSPVTGEIACASCLPSGNPPEIGYLKPTKGSTALIYDVVASASGPFMTNDGRVAFSTADALVAADTNQTLDVYEYVAGRAQLISSGTEVNYYSPAVAYLFSPLETGFEGFSANGVDLYFSTYDTLVPQDRNGQFVKFYDARTGGGFPVDRGLLPCTAADECHGDSSQAPRSLQVGTAAALGAGGGAAHGRKAKKHKRHRRRGHARHHKGRSGK